MEFSHRSVLLQESIDALAIRPDGIYLDGTLGGAGHSLEIARRLTTGRLIGIDQDTVALQAASQRLVLYRDRVKLVHANFRALDTVLHDAGLTGVDGMLFDLGVSSPQLDDSSRGFSYMADAPLDMRMDRDGCLSAYEIVNQTPEDELKRILWRYGEERYAPQIAAAIARRRAERPIETTLELAELVRSAMPAQARREKQHPAKRTFQAIRIAVNDELGAVEDMLGKASGRDYLPLVGGPNRKSSNGGGSTGLHLSAGIPGLYLRQKAAGAPCDEKTDRPGRGRAGGEPPRPQRKAARSGKAAVGRQKG